ncbi:hypothetical protein ACAW63_05900 [Pseudomonas sp. QE6]
MSTPNIIAITTVLAIYLWPYLKKNKTWLILLLGAIAWQGMQSLFD